MFKKKSYIFLFWFLFTINVYAAASDVEPEINTVPFVELLTHPEKYNNLKIRTIGYFHCKFEDVAVFLSKQDGDYLVGQNAFWVAFSQEQYFYSCSNNQDVTKDTVTTYEEISSCTEKQGVTKDTVTSLGELYSCSKKQLIVKGIEQYDMKLVQLEGWFSSKEHGHMGAYAGSINDVKVIRILQRLY